MDEEPAKRLEHAPSRVLTRAVGAVMSVLLVLLALPWALPGHTMVAAVGAHVAVGSIGVVIVVATPVLLAMTVATATYLMGSLGRGVIAGRLMLRRGPRSLVPAATSFAHLPTDLAEFGRCTVTMLEELEHFSQLASSVPKHGPQTPTGWLWHHVSAAFSVSSDDYLAESRVEREIWRWVIAAQKLGPIRLEELRGLGLEPSRVRKELSSSSALRVRLPTIARDIANIADVLSRYSTAQYRGHRLRSPDAAGAVGSTHEEAAAGQQEHERRFREIEKNYGAVLARLASRYTRTPADRDDLLQEIKLAIWNALPAYRGECSLRSYAISIARKRAVSAARQRPFPFGPTDHLPAPVDFDAHLVERERRGWLLRAIGALPRGIADALELRLAGESYKEISEALGISVSSVGVRIHSGKARLRAQVAGD